MTLSILRGETGDASTSYFALRVGQHLLGLAQITTPDGVKHSRIFKLTGHVGRVQRRVTALRTALLWVWASSAEPAGLMLEIERHAEILATSQKHPDSQRLAAQCMAAEEVAKIATQALKQWYGVAAPIKVRKRTSNG